MRSENVIGFQLISQCFGLASVCKFYDLAVAVCPLVCRVTDVAGLQPETSDSVTMSARGAVSPFCHGCRRCTRELGHAHTHIHTHTHRNLQTYAPSGA
eukprot:1963448-Amphidinium_carterae.1